MYYIAQDAFWKANESGDKGLSTPAFRAWLLAPKSSSSSAKLNICIDGEEVTGIERQEIINALSSDAIYNLQGQQLTQPQRGINIIGGRKVLIK